MYFQRQFFSVILLKKVVYFFPPNIKYQLNIFYSEGKLVKKNVVFSNGSSRQKGFPCQVPGTFLIKTANQ